jgi:outer membrane receptor for ferrienterochelin and colicins
MLSSIALVMALSLPAQITGQQSVTVHVTAEGRPISGARVSSGRQAGETDGRGLVTLSLPEVPADVAVEAKGYLPATVHVGTLPASGQLDVVLEPLPEFEDEVVVNASRSPTRIQDQPLRVEIIDREEIEEKALMTPGSVAMLIGETTGLRVQPTAPSLGAANVRIQGLRGRYSQMLADGLPLYGGRFRRSTSDRSRSSREPRRRFTARRHWAE